MEAFSRTGGYETKNLSSTYLVPEAGDEVVATSLELLNQIFGGMSGYSSAERFGYYPFQTSTEHDE